MNTTTLTREINTIAQVPEIAGKYFASKAALIIDDREVTFAEINARSNTIANALLREGVQAGDRIVYLGRDSAETVLLLFGAARSKAVFVNINWRFGPEEIAYILNDAAPHLLFVDEEFLRILPKISHAASGAKRIVVSSNKIPGHQTLWEWCEGQADSAPQMNYSPDDVVMQLYTSGTTGHPKGVRLASRSFFALVQQMEAAGDSWVNWTEATVSLICVPTFHVAGVWQVVRGLALGSTTVMMRSFDPAAILRLIPKYRVSLTGMVPSMLYVTLSEPGCTTADFSSLKTIVYGGAPVSAALLKKAMSVFGCDFFQIYGLTETGNMAVCLRAEDHLDGNEHRLTSAGRPLPGVEVRILDERGSASARAFWAKLPFNPLRAW